ncbi:MAG: RimK family alpha-L-glutamate ligase [Crocinitomicaceae bacterium]
MTHFDITILTDHRYLATHYENEYSQNVFDEDNLLKEALERLGYNVHRTNWDDKQFDWSTTNYIFFRTTWDYFDRYEEFAPWLEEVCTKTKLINPKDLIYWSLDKHYLRDLDQAGVHIPNTLFIEKGDSRSLSEIIESIHWQEFILKPAISGAARHTYRFTKDESAKHEAIFSELIASESMLIQEFQTQILTKGEVAFMVFGGKFSHAVLKKAKAGDFRVQDDFGGTIEIYHPNEKEIAFVEKAFAACNPTPIYARIDVIWDNDDQLCIGEIELIEPELWFRLDEQSADRCAIATQRYINSK